MRSILVLIAMCVALFTASSVLSPALSQTGKSPFTFVGGLALGTTELSFDSKLDADTSFNTYTLFGSLGFNKAYASLSFADSIDSKNVSEEDELGQASRRDTDFTLGYRLTGSWTVFAGYKQGETDIDFQIRDTDLNQSEYYREEGIFVGASYTYRFKRAGNLSATLAYIQYDTDMRFTEGADDDDEEEAEADEPLEFDDLEGEFSGDSTGYSAGISWLMPLSKSLAFRTQLKVNAFDLEVNFEGQRFEPRQRLSFFDVGLLYILPF